MKFPSIFRVAQHARFEIKPRYYDPVKEEIDQRTSRIRKELQSEGKLPLSEDGDSELRYSSTLRGAFAAGSQIRGRSTSPFNNAGLIRLGIFILLIISVFGYIYFGPDALYTLAYVIGGIALLAVFFKIKGSPGK